MPASDAKNYLEQASALIKIGNFQEAIPLYESALATLERIHGGDQPEIAECLQELGEAYEAAYRLSDALRIHTRLLRLGEKVLGKTNPNVVAMQFKLCQINEMLGKPADAFACCQIALDAAKQCLAQDDPLSQQIIDRYRFLSSLAQIQGQGQGQAQVEPSPQPMAPPQLTAQPHLNDMSAMQAPTQFLDPAQLQAPTQFQDPAHFQDQAAQAWQSEHGSSDLNSNEIISQPSGGPSMQDFAREMLRDMPGSPIFNQSISSQQTSAQQMPTDQPIIRPNTAPDMVAPTAFSQQGGPTDSSAGYKSLLEAGFSAAQNAAVQRLPSDVYSAVIGSAPPPPPAYEPGGEGYNLSDLDDIRSGRRSTSEMYTEIKPSRPRRMSQDENKKVELARLAKILAFPAIGAITLIIVMILVFTGKHDSEPNPAANQEANQAAATAGSSKGSAKATSFGTYRTSDGRREIRLVSPTEAVLATGSSAISVPYTIIDNNLGALISAIAGSAFEKQIWVEKKDFGLKTQDEIAYYVGDGTETKVMNKMRRLGGAVQAYFLKHSEYPRYVPAAMASDFAFVNPDNGRGAPIQIRTLLSQTSDAEDARSGLESGLELGLAPNSEPATTIHNPFAITCYAVIIGKPGDDLEQMRATKFFIRGCDRDGNFLASGESGRSYVVVAENALLSSVPSAPPSTAKNKAKSKTRSGGKQSTTANAATTATKEEQADVSAQPVSTAQIEPPTKSTKLWLIVQPALPMILFHHALPLILIVLAVLAFLRSRMVKNDPTGTSISSSRDMVAYYSQIAACVFLGLAFIVLLAQFLVFS